MFNNLKSILFATLVALGVGGMLYAQTYPLSQGSTGGLFDGIVTNAGTFAVQVDGAALTSLQLADDTVATIGATVGNRMFLFDGADTQITSFAGTEFAEDTQHSTGDAGIMSLGVENADQAALTAGDKDYTPIAVSAEGNTLMELISSNIDLFLGTDFNVVFFQAQTNQAEETAHASGDYGFPIWTVRDDTPVASSTVSTNDYAAFKSDAFGGLYVRLLGVAGAAFEATDLLSETDFDAVFGTASLIGPGAEAGALLVTLATDSTGVITVDDGGGSLSVRWGGSAPPLGAGLEATALRVTVATDSTGLLPVNVTEWGSAAVPIGAGVEATAVRVTLPTDGTGIVGFAAGVTTAVTNAGTFVVQEDGAALTALQLIDNAISGAGFNITQLAGVNVTMNTGIRDAGTQRVTVATDDLVPVSTRVTSAFMAELAIVELIGINEVVTTDQWSASALAILNGTGHIRRVCLYATEDGSGVVFTPAGRLTFFDADPAIASDDATITAAERLTIHTYVDFVAGDFEADANGSSGCVELQDGFGAFSSGTFRVAYHSAAGETQWNSAAGDDEQLEMNLWYERIN